MTVSLTPELLQKVNYAAYTGVWNRKKPIPLDRKEMPWLSYLNKRKKTSPQAGGEAIVKLQKNGGLQIQFWDRRDVLGFQEPSIELEISYPFTNVHVGLEVVHEDLVKMGYFITPNGPRGKNFAKPMAEDEANRLVDYFETIVEDMMDTYDIKLDEAWLRDGSYDSTGKAPVGLDGLLPMDPTAGSIGGKSRSNVLLRHTVETGLTTVASGTLRAGMTRARRNANLNGRGRAGMVDFIMAGSSFIEGYVAFATANNIQFQAKFGQSQDRVDIGMPESGYHFENIPIVWNPTFDVLDTRETASVPWSKRAYMLNSKTFVWAYQAGRDKLFSAPLDPADQRISKLSLDGRYALMCTVPNANAVVSIA